jgi:hypothetical protein
MTENLKSPYPYFGGKSKVSPLVWQRFGEVVNYVEPFAGSLAVLLGRPSVDYDHLPKETVNDKDGFISNFWRSVSADPDAVAHYADWPANENDLHARHSWLVNQAGDMTAKLEGDPDYYDPKAAGWWVWGIALWIGSGWCSSNGPWQSVEMEDGTRQLIHVGDNGQGINRKLIHVGTFPNKNETATAAYVDGVRRQRPQLGNGGTGQGVTAVGDLQAYMRALQDRLRRVRVCSGDWSRVMGKSVTYRHGLTAVFLDPPYAAEAKRQRDLYRRDCLKISHDVREWAIANGNNPLLRIALCGYEDEHAMPDNWDCVAWTTNGGYAGQSKDGKRLDNGTKERIWFSPYCLRPIDNIMTGIVDTNDYSGLFDWTSAG